MVVIASLLFAGCSKEKGDDDDLTGTGFLEVKCINPMGGSSKGGVNQAKADDGNPPLEDEITETIMTSMKLGIGDVWVSQGVVREGEPDNLEWIKLTAQTNAELKLFEDYTFPAVELPAGEYKSIKIKFRNIFYRHCKLISDPSVVYELLETMGSSTDPCNPNDDSWAADNYFSTGGNFALKDGKFKLALDGEKVGGFTIKSGKTARILWRLGAGVTEPCINYLIDINGNGQWDCGIDKIDIECPPSVEYMWDFVVQED